MTTRLLFYVVIFLLQHSASAGEIVLGPNESLILIDFKYESSIRRYKRSASRLLFGKVGSKQQFYVAPSDSPQLLKVSSGTYYLKNIDFPYSNVVNRNIPEPADGQKTILIAEGSLNYIGDWVVKERKRVPGGPVLHFDVTFGSETMLKISKSTPTLKTLPLVVSKAGRPLMELSWN